MKQSETKFKEKVLRDLKGMPQVWYFKVQTILRGIPDIIGCIRGQFFALELKTEKGKAQPLQLWVISLIQAAGGYAKVVTPSEWMQVKNELYELGDDT